MKKFLLALFTVILAAANLYPQSQHVNQERGFNANRAYNDFDIDHINTFNGNLVINIPLGQPYKVGGNLSYSFNLVYNSFIWSNEQQCTAGSTQTTVTQQFSALFSVQRAPYTCPSANPNNPDANTFCRELLEQLQEVYEVPVLLDFGVLDVPARTPDRPDCFNMPSINPASNAGVGWQLNFGKMFRPHPDVTTVAPHYTERLYETYQSPDGSEHQFYPTLHDGEPANSAGDTPNYYFTRDSSYIRMWRNPIPETAYYESGNYSYVLYFPNGEKHYFQWLRTRNAGMTENGTTYGIPFNEDKLVKIADQFGNEVTFDYYDSVDDDDGTPGPADELKDNLMLIRDSIGRTHRIEFTKPAGQYTSLIKFIKLQAINGATAQYTLKYGETPEELSQKEAADKFETTTLIANPHPQKDKIEGYNTGTGSMAEKINLPYLTSIELPEGGMKYAMPIDQDDQAQSYYQPLSESVYITAPGALRRMTLPTGAEIQWDYEVEGDDLSNLILPNGQRQRYGYFFSAASTGRIASRLAPGVRRRRLIFKRLDPQTQQPVIAEESVWKYDPLLGLMPAGCNRANAGEPCGAHHIVNTVTTPEGDFTKYYYSVYPHPQGANANNGRSLTQPHLADYGLPLSKEPGLPIRYDHGTPSKPLFLSTQTFDKGGALKRETYVRYDMDKFIRSDGFGSSSSTNQRLAASATYFYDDGETFDEIINSDFNGLGSFRKTERYSNFNNVTLPTVTELYYSSVETNYTSGGSFSVDPTTNQPVPGNNFIPIPLEQPWITGLYDRIIKRDRVIGSSSSTAVREDYEFGNNGLLNRKRVYTKVAGTNEEPVPNEHDVLTTYAYSPTGNLIIEDQSGGDKQNLNNNPAFEYRITYGYPACGGSQLGIVKTAQYAGSMFKNVDNDIDCSSGLVKTSRDTAEYPTEYRYDLLGRVTNIYQGTQGSLYEANSTLVNYIDPRDGTSLQSPTIKVFEYATRLQSGAALTEKEYNYDKLGRLTIERVKMPDGKFSVRDRKFNAMGWKLNESEWLDEDLWRNCAPNDPNSECKKKTDFLNFDAFGRPTKIVLPDNKVINRAFKGEREIYENMTVGGSVSLVSTAVVEQLSERWERYDQFGQLTQVEEQSGTNGAKIKTTYGYGVLGKIGWACSGSGTVQCRSFRYDGRGNLTAEAHPERGWSEYSGYDTMNNIGSSWDGVNALNYQYDFAGRPTRIQNYLGKTFKEFTYSTANNGAGGAFSKGKLETSKRYNHVINPYEWTSTTPPAKIEIAVGESYKYSGIGGRLSERSVGTNIAFPYGPSFRQTFTYDKLGNLAAQSYPECTNPDCTNSGQQRSWSVNYGYSRNFLTNVGGGAGQNNTTAGTYAPSITYNINQTVGSITHGNGMIDTESIDPKNMPRTREISVKKGSLLLWTTGAYGYDGAGNVTTAGNDWFLYDKANRLKEGTALLGTAAKNLKQEYEYDSFGNVMRIRTYDNVSRSSKTLRNDHVTNTFSATNRLDVNYDAAGNVLGLKNLPPTYTYDDLNMISTVYDSTNQTTPRWTYLYGPNDERFWIIDNQGTPFDHSDNTEFFSLRGLKNEVLREYKIVGGSAVGHWFWQKDYVYRGTKLLAAELPGANGRRHYHVDHLGSPRLVTDNSSVATTAVRETISYLPFGETGGAFQNANGTFSAWSLTETFNGESPSRLRFTGHEKDNDVFSLDYMHARYYLERGGKFMSVDPGRDFNPKNPQSWNLYSYVRNNPVNATDPTGRNMYSSIFQMAAHARAFQEAQNMITPEVIKSIREAVKITGFGNTDIEAGFRIDNIGSVNNVPGYQVHQVYTSNKRKSHDFKFSGNTTDLFHTHSGKSSENPSTPDTTANKKPETFNLGKGIRRISGGDTAVGDATGIRIWVIHRNALTVYVPATKHVYTIMEGAAWQNVFK
ncbi:MAG: RHS repeat-associated core domain-containing protein [Pyrinomonadaceae bacterium]|nr:RHS repeat-associated core domain-containing protein [Pyrinomonadaceae bacterium]